MPGWLLRVTCMLAIAGCGRVSFDPLGDDTLDDANGDGDAPTGMPETLTFPAVADTALNSFAPTLNYGAGTTFNVRSDQVSTYVALLRFDLSSASGRVTSATLRISTSTQVFTTGRIDFSRVLEAWDEGTQTGGAGTANYAMRQGLMIWTAMGCGPGSRDTAVVASLQPTSMNTRYDVTLPPTLVQEWIAGPAANHGLALFAQGTVNDSVVFFARESAMAPELIVDVVR
jgi:hypothetical protein